MAYSQVLIPEWPCFVAQKVGLKLGQVRSSVILSVFIFSVWDFSQIENMHTNRTIHCLGPEAGGE